MKSKLLSLLILLCLPMFSFAYTVYNNTSYNIYVWDGYDHCWYGHCGIDKYLAAGQNASCDSSAEGCYGYVMLMASNEGGLYQCRTEADNLAKGEAGYYFVITETNIIPFPNSGWCRRDIYHD